MHITITADSATELLDEIRYRIHREPIEDGYSHSAEPILAALIRDFADDAPVLISDLYMQWESTKPSDAAILIRLIGREECCLKIAECVALATIALHSDNVELRDAAVVAFENWGGAVSTAILRDHLPNEQCTWLTRYIEQVIDDLAECAVPA